MLRVARSLLLLIAAVTMFVPVSPAMPVGTLDSSWAFAMNQAVAQRLSFGDQIIFSFGPYTCLYTQLYHPSTNRMMLVGGIYLALSCWVALTIVLDRVRWPWIPAFFIAAVMLRQSRDAVLFLLPLLSGLGAWRLASLPHDRELETPLQLARVALLFAPLGLLPLIKGSALVLSVLVGGLSAIMWLARGRWRSMAVGLTSAAVALLIFWMAAGEYLLALPGYLLQQVRFSSAYTDAMSIDGNVEEIVYYLLATVMLLLAIAAARQMTKEARLFHVAVYGAFLFVAFKGGFVRHDYHALIASGSFLFGALLVPSVLDARLAIPIVVMAAFTWSHIGEHYPQMAANDLGAAFRSFYSSVRTGIGGLRQSHDEYDRALQTIRNDVDLPRMAGTTDIYSFDQAHLLVSANTWLPRPVFQSYAAFSPDLAGLNRKHLIGPTAPDNIVFRVETIDARLPSLDDGPSWPVLLSRYGPRQSIGPFLLLSRTQRREAPPEPVVMQRSLRAIGERVVLPRSRRPLFASVQMKPTPLGRLATLLFKSDALQIRLELIDGSSRLYRLIPGMAAAGFLVSPLIESTAEFGMLYGDEHLLAHKSVAALTIESGGTQSRHWNRQYEISFSEVDRGLGNGAEIPSIYGLRDIR
jgi:hypothetical protein